MASRRKSASCAPLDIDSVICRLTGSVTAGPQQHSSASSSSSVFPLHHHRPSLRQHLDVSEREIRAICQLSRELLLAQPMMLELSAPLKIVGDIHGQFSDLIRLFRVCGFPPSSNYLFLGDYVDRGPRGLETILLLLCYKLKYPLNFFLLRGNHEVASLNRIYGFYNECKNRASVRVWKAFQDVFNCLPVSALINGKIFCCHGGLSPHLRTLEQLKRIQRPVEVQESGLLCDLLWSDPDATVQTGWAPSDRGVSYVFGADVLHQFLARMDLDLVVRGHQVVEDGYEFFGRRGLVTLFSAPNYCGEFDNAGAVMNVDRSLLCSFQILKPLTAATTSHNNISSKIITRCSYPPPPISSSSTSVLRERNKGNNSNNGFPTSTTTSSPALPSPPTVDSKLIDRPPVPPPPLLRQSTLLRSSSVFTTAR